MFKLITMSIIGWALFSGGISRAQVTNATAPAIDVYDGFEAAGLSKVWDTSRFVPGELKITHQIGPHQTTLYETKEKLRNQWLDFKFQIRFSTNENGRIKAWLDNKQIVDYQGVNGYPENEQTGYANPSRFYFKMGLYRDLMAEPMTIYIDEYRKKELPENAL